MAAPTSLSGRPKRRSGMRRASSTNLGWAKNVAFTSVRKNPGAIALATIPFSPSSTASARTSALYGIEPLMAVKERIEKYDPAILPW